MNAYQTGGAVAGLGLLLLIVSFIWPSVHNPHSEWSDKDAQEYGETVARVHQGAHAVAQAQQGTRLHGGTPVGPEQIAQHRKDQEKLEELTVRLEHARENPARIASIFKWSGAGLVLVGVLLLSAGRNWTG